MSVCPYVSISCAAAPSTNTGGNGWFALHSSYKSCPLQTAMTSSLVPCMMNTGAFTFPILEMDGQKTPSVMKFFMVGKTTRAPDASGHTRIIPMARTRVPRSIVAAVPKDFP